MLLELAVAVREFVSVALLVREDVPEGLTERVWVAVPEVLELAFAV